MSASVQSTDHVTVVGGGIAGLVAATEIAEAGVGVRLVEARRRLGGRAASSPAPWMTNLGPHALYTGTALWDWLRARELHRPAPMPKNSRVVFVSDGRASRMPPLALLRPALRLGADRAPIDEDLASWATRRWGPDTARALIGLAGPLTYDHDPGRVSAAFVAPRIRDFLLRQPPSARYVPGGWTTMIDRMTRHARDVGVVIDTDAKVDAAGLEDLRRSGPVIMALGPAAARRLLGDEAAPDDQRRVAMLDVGVVRRRRDPYLIWDLDRIVFSTRVSAVVPDVAPDGHELVQLSSGMAPEENLDDAVTRLEATLDTASPGWRDREVWRRRSAVRGSTGAVDLPGTTWRDRPAVSRGDGLWVAGDWVAAPGHLASVSVASAHEAATGAIVEARRATRARPMVSPMHIVSA